MGTKEKNLEVGEKQFYHSFFAFYSTYIQFNSSNDPFAKNSPTETSHFVMNVYYEQTTLQCSHFYSSVHAWSEVIPVTLTSWGRKKLRLHTNPGFLELWDL